MDTASDTAGDTADTADTGHKEASALVQSMALFPDGVTAHPGASYSLRLVGRWDDGVISDITGAYSSSDDSIATVDKDGVVTAHAAGSVTLTATWDALSEQVGLTIVDDGVLTITIVDAETGAPISDAKVKVFEDDVAGTELPALAAFVHQRCENCVESAVFDNGSSTSVKRQPSAFVSSNLEQNWWRYILHAGAVPSARAERLRRCTRRPSRCAQRR